MKKNVREIFYPELRGCQCVKYGENIYFFAKNYNILSKINIQTNTIEVVGSLFNEIFDKEYLITCLLRYEEKIICVPNRAEYIFVVDLNEKNEIGHETLGNTPLSKRAFCNVYLQKDYCFFFPFTGKELLKVDLRQKKVMKSVNVKKLYQDNFGEDYTYFSCSDIYAFKDKVYMVMFENARVVEVDICSMGINFYNLNGKSTHYIHLVGCGHLLYIFGVDGRVYIWNIVEHVMENVILLEFKERGSERYSYSVKNTKYIYIFKYIPSDEFIRINIETNQIETLSLTDIFHLEKKKRGSLIYMTSEGNKFYFLSESSELFILDFEMEVADIYSLLLDIDSVHECVKAHEKELSVLHAEPILEGRYIWTLENYLRKYINMEKDKRISEDESKGNRIYEALKVDVKY